MASVVSLLGRGAAAGAAAGAVSAGFGFLVAEPVIDRAIAFEEQHSAAGDHAVAAFSRGEQQFGLLVAMLAVGIAVGVLFGIVYAVLHRADPLTDPWRRSLRLAGGGFLAVFLLPYLRYPANPPGVGDPATVDLRTRAWIAAIAIGVVTVALAAGAAGWLAQRGAAEPLRHLAAVGVVLLGFGAMFLLPSAGDPIAVPAQLLWEFRLLSAGSMLLLWSALGAGFGLLGGYAAKRAAASQLTPAGAAPAPAS